jgi:hypothetical protein
MRRPTDTSLWQTPATLTQWLPWKLSVAHLSWAVVALCGAWVWAALGIRGDYQTLNHAAVLAHGEPTPWRELPAESGRTSHAAHARL